MKTSGSSIQGRDEILTEGNGVIYNNNNSRRRTSRSVGIKGGEGLGGENKVRVRVGKLETEKIHNYGRELKRGVSRVYIRGISFRMHLHVDGGLGECTKSFLNREDRDLKYRQIGAEEGQSTTGQNKLQLLTGIQYISLDMRKEKRQEGMSSECRRGCVLCTLL